MAKARVHEIARELGLSSRDAIEKLRVLGVAVTSHSSMLDEEAVARLRDLVRAPRALETPPPETAGGSLRPPGSVHVPRGVTVEEFAKRVERPPSEIIKILMLLGELKNITQSLSDEEVELLAAELGVKVGILSPDEEPEEEKSAGTEEAEQDALLPRPPVVTVMGHVDHGKSSILQHFRKKEMLSSEAGGITQAIGAYQVHSGGRVATFIDTPGHEAFTRMRARGAQVTDIAILVVAAEDGVQPQTIEALEHARAASVPVIVAVNKIDKPEADPQRVRQQLAELGLTPEEWGGDTVFVDVSAKYGTNLDQLLDMVHLVAELQELKANPNTPARGVAIEAHLDRGRGAVATLAVQRGTLRVGDPVVCGSAWCRVRSLIDENGHHLKEALPSQPVQVSGWSRVPGAGDEFRAVAEEREAKRLAQGREHKIRQAEQVAAAKPVTLEELLSRTRAGEMAELRLVAKAGTQGSLEALVDSLEKINEAGVRVNVIRRGVGAIGENDVTLAQASGAIVVGFNVRPDAAARQLSEREGVDVRAYQVIYQLLNDIQQAVKGLLAPVEEEVVVGSAEVRATFKVPRAVAAGCYITEGRIRRGGRARLIRDGVVVYTGHIATLRRFKEDAREVATGFECGVTLSDYNDIKDGDVIETFEVREVARA